ACLRVELEYGVAEVIGLAVAAGLSPVIGAEREIAPAVVHPGAAHESEKLAETGHIEKPAPPLLAEVERHDLAFQGVRLEQGRLRIGVRSKGAVIAREWKPAGKTLLGSVEAGKSAGQVTPAGVMPDLAPDGPITRLVDAAAWERGLVRVGYRFA